MRAAALATPKVSRTATHRQDVRSERARAPSPSVSRHRATYVYAVTQTPAAGHRFFSLASHDRWHDMLSQHATIKSFDTYPQPGANDWHYQFALLKV